MYIELILAAVLIIILVVIILATRRNTKLPRGVTKNAERKINHTKDLDPEHAVLESHKIFIFTLATLVGENQRKRIKAVDVVKKFANKFPNTEHVWKSHRLRNRIAHEPDIKITNTHADLARRDFIRALKSITK